jgi:hypothetical protein
MTVRRPGQIGTTSVEGEIACDATILVDLARDYVDRILR